MKHIYAIFCCLMLSFSTQAQLVINEVSQGSSGTKEFIELVVIGTKTCTDSTADLRRWIVDDNTMEWYGNGGNAAGFVRFKNITQWAAIPYGSIILLYNNLDKNISITAADDPTDANNDGVYILPINSTLLEFTNNNSYATASYTSPANWTPLGMRNGGDAVVTVHPNNITAGYHSVAYGSNANANLANINLPSAGGGNTVYLTNGNYNNTASWQVGDALANVATTDETPGAPNTTANASWINGMKNPANINGIRIQENVSICNGQLPYTWRTKTITTFGSAVDSLVKGACDTTFVLNLLQAPSVTANINQTICAQQLPYTWNGKTVNTIGTHTLRDTSVTIGSGCDSFTVLTLVVNDYLAVNRPMQICQGALPFTWNGQTVNAVGSFTLKDTVSSLTSCDTIITLLLQVNLNKTNTISHTLCQNQLPYTWNAQTVNTVGSHVLTHTYLSAAGCDSVVTMNVTVRPTFTTNISETICANQLPFVWNAQTINTIGTHQLKDTLTTVLGCDSFINLTLTVRNIATSTLNRTVCSNDLPFVFHGNSYSSAGTYTVNLLAANGCDSVVTLNLTTSAPAITVLDTLRSCDSLLFDGQTYYASASVAKTIYNSLGCDSVYKHTYIAISFGYTQMDTVTICEKNPYNFYGTLLSVSGNYQHVIPSNLGCDSVFYLHLIATKVPELQIAIDPLARYCIGDTINVRYAGAFDMKWEPEPLYSNINGVGFVVNNNTNEFTLNGSNGGDCVSSKSLTINAEMCCEIAIPNAFSPNGDGMNDVFIPVFPGNTSYYTLSIFDRWGQRVFKSNAIHYGWDGNVNGMASDIGVYFYILEVDCNGQRKLIKGDITLLR